MVRELDNWAFRDKIKPPLGVLEWSTLIHSHGASMDVTVWRNGRRDRAGVVYGVRVSRTDRDRFFDPRAPEINIEIGGKPVHAKLTPSFWRSCTEIRHPEIAKFIIDHGLAKWPSRRPHSLHLEPVGKNRFRLS